jgi:hypothetical protein
VRDVEEAMTMAETPERVTREPTQQAMATRRRDRLPNRHTEECTGCGARRKERHDEDCRGHLGSGIRNLDAARRSIRRRYGQGAPEPIARRPGARFYVTARSGRRTAYLLGPFASHMTAQAAVPRARQELHSRYPHDAPWMALGTASRPDTVPTVLGR